MTKHHARPGMGLPSAAAIALALGVIAGAGCSKTTPAPPPPDREPAAATAMAAELKTAQQPEVVAPSQSPECDQFLQTQESKAAASTSCSPTEQLAFRKSPKCLSCLLHATCLDDQFGDTGNECEPSGPKKAADDFAIGAPEEAQCLAVFACDLGVTPAAHPAPVHGGVNSGPLRPFCGDINVNKCFGATGPQGACKAAITAAYPPSLAAGAQSIALNIAQRRYPGGRAGAIIGCADANECTACFE